MTTQVAPASAGTTLSQLLHGRATLAAVAAHLEGLAVQQRVDQMRALDALALRELWGLAKAASPLTVSDILPPSREPFKPLHWAGKNSLPALNHFEKRFFRDETGRVWGYNHQVTALAGAVTGPGYFAVSAHPEHSDEVLNDYARLPEKAPPGWPAITSNSRGLSYFVFHNMKDSLRRVCEGVATGQANKAGQYFGLVRVDS